LRSAPSVVNRTGRAANNPVGKLGLGERLACLVLQRGQSDVLAWIPELQGDLEHPDNSLCHAGLVFVAGALLSGKGLLDARRLNGAEHDCLDDHRAEHRNPRAATPAALRPWSLSAVQQHQPSQQLGDDQIEQSSSIHRSSASSPPSANSQLRAYGRPSATHRAASRVDCGHCDRDGAAVRGAMITCAAVPPGG
jgi:hypothetical protein